MTVAVRPARLPAAISQVPFAQASLEELTPLGALLQLGGRRFRWPSGTFLFPTRSLRVRGWMLTPDGPFERIHAFVNGEELFTCAPEFRPDIQAAFPHVPDSGRAQFSFEIPRRIARHGRVDIVGRRLGEPIGRMQFRFRLDLERVVPTPPARLTQCVVNTADSRFFLAQGYKSFDEMNLAIRRHSDGKRIDRLLDWGCGCGRLTAHWLRKNEIADVHGCDINADAIDWCRTNLTRGKFEVVDFSPPTCYPDAHFDAIAAYSVFTHLTAPAQDQWLAEMKRILRPGGIFAASVHGASAAYFRFGPQANSMLATGIHDGTVATGMETVLAADAYRDTYQTEAYTRSTFGRHFDILEYAERGVGNNQDLIVLRKPG